MAGDPLLESEKLQGLRLRGGASHLQGFYHQEPHQVFRVKSKDQSPVFLLGEKRKNRVDIYTELSLQRSPGEVEGLGSRGQLHDPDIILGAKTWRAPP